MRSSLLAMLLVSTVVAAEPLVGPGVGSADALLAEGSKLYNQKKYAQASEAFLKASRANPSAVNAYLQLARSLLAAKQLSGACYAYRVYLKATPETPDRKKAQGESELCERQLKANKKQPPDPGPKFVEGKAAFFAALEANRLIGAGSASEQLRSLVMDGFLGPELGEMANKLLAVATETAEGLHGRALKGDETTTETLRSARPLYEFAIDLGASPSDHQAKSAFLEGLAEIQEGQFKKAEELFSSAAQVAPGNKEYRFHRAMAIYRSGEAQRALASMEADLPGDARTAVLRAALALEGSSEKGAVELEQLLFSRRFP